MNIEEGNKLILEFLGFKLINDDPQEYPQGYYHNSNDEYDLGIFENGCLQEQAEFHKSWDWLMLITDKIKTLDESEFNYQATNMTLFRMQKKSLLNMSISSEIEVVYSQIVDFIKWYNNAKNN